MSYQLMKLHGKPVLTNEECTGLKGIRGESRVSRKSRSLCLPLLACMGVSCSSLSKVELTCSPLPTSCRNSKLLLDQNLKKGYLILDLNGKRLYTCMIMLVHLYFWDYINYLFSFPHRRLEWLVDEGLQRL